MPESLVSQVSTFSPSVTSRRIPNHYFCKHAWPLSLTKARTWKKNATWSHCHAWGQGMSAVLHYEMKPIRAPTVGIPQRLCLLRYQAPKPMLLFWHRFSLPSFWCKDFRIQRGLSYQQRLPCKERWVKNTIKRLLEGRGVLLIENTIKRLFEGRGLLLIENTI